MNSHKRVFLEKVFLGRETNFNNPDDVIHKCIKNAYRDMLTAGKYYLTNDMETRCRKLIRILEKNQYKFSRNIIDESLVLFGNQEIIGMGNKYVTRYGLAQKIVNMTYKNFYICSDYIGHHIDFSDCDCPLDSIILSKLPKIDVVWSKLTKDKYELCQNNIAHILQETELDHELENLGNLAFDFLNW